MSKKTFKVLFLCTGNSARSILGEVCPVWPGQPMTAHWGIDDPAAAKGSDADKRNAFVTAFTQLSRRISLFISLPVEKLDKLSLKRQLDDIGRLRENGE